MSLTVGSPAGAGMGLETTAPGGTPDDGSLAPPLREVWRARPDDDGRLSPPVLAGVMVVAVGATRVVAIDPESGETAWTVPRADGDLISPAVDPEGRIVIYAEGRRPEDSAIVAVDAATQEERWRTAIDPAGLGGPSVLGGRVFVGTRPGAVVALDLLTGEELWRVGTDGRVDAALGAAGNLVVAVSENTDTGRVHVYGLRAEGCGSATCQPLWDFSPRQFALNVSSPTVAADTVFVGLGDFTVYALGAEDGRVRWETPVRGDFSPLSSPAVTGADLFAVDRLGGVHRLDAATGTRVWDYQFPTTATVGSPLVVGDTVYAGLDDGGLVAIRVRNGHLVWRMDLGAGPTGALVRAVVPAGDLLLAPSVHRGGGLVALRHDPGGTLVDIPSPTELRLGPALLNFGVAAGGLLVVLLLLFRFLDRRRRHTGGDAAGRDAAVPPDGSGSEARR